MSTSEGTRLRRRYSGREKDECDNCCTDNGTGKNPRNFLSKRAKRWQMTNGKHGRIVALRKVGRPPESYGIEAPSVEKRSSVSPVANRKRYPGVTMKG